MVFSFTESVCVCATFLCREECVGVSSETPVVLNSQKTVTWAVAGGAEPQLDEAELKKMSKLEKAGIKVLPASVRYSRSEGYCSDSH